MAASNSPKSPIRLLFFAVLLSGLLLGLTSAPVRASTAYNSPPRQQTAPSDDSPDLSEVLLRLEDMPPGFEDLQEAQKQAMSQALSQLAGAFGANTQMSPQNVTGYWNADASNPQFVVSLLISPLSEAEQRSFDDIVEKPEEIKGAMGQMFGSSTQAELLEAIDQVGEASIGFSVIVSASGINMRMEFISARRGQVIEEVLVAYLVTAEPLADVRQMARILDDRLAKAIGVPVVPITTVFRPTALLVPELTTHIPTPLDISTDPAVVGTNLLLAAIVMILLTIAFELANRTLEENEALLERWFRPLSGIGRFFRGIGAAVGKLGRDSIVLSLLTLALLILIYGLTFSLLEPGWSFLSTTGFWLFLCLTVGGGIVGLADDVIQWATARRWGAPTAIRLHPANLLIAFASTGFSRLFGVVPGFMFGSPQAIDIDPETLEKRRQTRLVWTGAATALLIGLGLWLATILTNLLQRADLPHALTVAVGGVESLFLSIFALAVQNAFVQMLDLPDTYGRALKRLNRWVWLLLLLAITFLFYHTLINPKGNLASAWGSVSVKVFVITAAVGMTLSLLMWLAFRLLNRGRGKAVPPAWETDLPTVVQTAAQASDVPPSEPSLEPAGQTAAQEIDDSDQPQATASDKKKFDLDMGPTRNCPQCSQAIPLEAQFCLFCGTRVGAQPPPPPSTGRPTSRPPTQPGLPAARYSVPAPPNPPAKPAGGWYQPPQRRVNTAILVLLAAVLVLCCCIAAAALGWWQREHIPGLSGLLNPPTATATPRPTRTPRPTPALPRTQPPVVEEAVVTAIVITAPAEKNFTHQLCLLPDGDIHDKSFNALAWGGLQTAAAQYGAQTAYSEPTGTTEADYRSALDKLLPLNCDLIVGVGFLTSEAIRAAAIANPAQKFLLLDHELTPPLGNVWSQTYASEQGSFLAGYLAAALSRTGKVATFGGMDIPPVRSYMNGFAAGVSYYNAAHNSHVQVVGWDSTNQAGLFTNDFNNAQQGIYLSKQLISQGADILFPVAGATGNSAATEATTHSSVYVIGADNDWVVARPEYAGVILTSVEKRLDISIFLAAAAIGSDTFRGGSHVGTLASEVSLAPFHNLDWMVSDALRAELEQVKAGILTGRIDTQLVSTPTPGGELAIWTDTPPAHLERWMNKYQLANLDVEITITSVPSGELVDRWKLSIAAGTGPDLLLTGNTLMYPEWARSGLILPLDDFLSDELDGVSKAALTNLTVDGKLYGIPYNAYSLALYYNKSLLPNPPKTMDELSRLVSQGKKLTLFRVTYFMFSFYTAFGGQLMDENGRCIADQNAAFADALRYLQGLAKNGAVLTNDWLAYIDPFSSGQAAMTINGPWVLQDFQDALGDNLGVALIPRGVAPAASLLGVNTFLVNPNSRNPHLAVDFAQFMASPEAQADLDVGNIPVRTDLAFEAGDPIAVFVQSAATGYPEALLTNNFYPAFEAMLTAVLDSGSDPASAVRDACQQMNAANGK